MGFIEGIKTFFQRLKHDFLLVTGKKSAENAGGALAGGGTLASVVTMGLASAVSVGLTQMEYRRETDEIKDFYKDELAAQLKKPENRLTRKDLNTLAEGDQEHGVHANRVISEAFAKTRKKRNVGVVLAVVATLAALTFVHWALPATASVLAHMLTGLVSYNAVKTPLSWIADKTFGLDRETAHERIVDIKKDREAGKIISREQALAVFAAANPDLDRMIEAGYGKGFDQLKLVDKQQVTENIGKLLHLDQLVTDINQGRINVSELAFTVQGDISGVAPKESSKPRRNVFAVVGDKWRGVISRMTGRIPAVSGRPEVTVNEQVAVMEYRDGSPRKSFTEKLGLSRVDTSIGHVERLEQSRGDLPIVQR